MNSLTVVSSLRNLTAQTVESRDTGNKEAVIKTVIKSTTTHSHDES